ncbi:MAG: YlxR family protein [Chthonomonadales bacterium]|nr:YlxR family protein [Chthonomonadales bacterium]
MGRARHIPLRMCAACRTSGDKRGLLRVVRSPAGEVAIDPSGKANGRGAYVCAAAACIEMARRKRSLERGLKVPVPQDVFDALLRSAEARPAEDA